MSSSPTLSNNASALPHLWLPYCQMETAPYPAIAETTHASSILLEDGTTLTDGIASWWTSCHGYNHPHLIKALKDQAEKMPHIMFGGMIHAQAKRLAQRLTALLPDDLERVFFTDSGSVAMEVASKMALQYHLNKGDKKRHKLLSFKGGYHGDTLGMMSICDPEEGMHALFGNILPQQIVTDLPRTKKEKEDFEHLLEKRASSIAAMIIEPLVQGAGGMIFHTPELLRYLRKLCDRYHILLIFDEVFTGFGRTGALFACQKAQVTPDIIALSKALTGGTMALAATIARRFVFEAFLSDNPLHALMHGPTFMANPLACAVANASLDLFEQEDRIGQVQKIEAQLKTELAPCCAFESVKDVRVMGALGVIELHHLKDAPTLSRLFLEKKVWIRPFRNIIYLTPAFTITPEELSILTNAIFHILKQHPHL